MLCRSARESVSAFLMALFLMLLTGCSGSTGVTSSTEGTVDREPTDPESPATTESPNTVSGPPSVELSAIAEVVDPGEIVQLSWSSENASECSASGGWSGSRNTSGSASVGPIEGSTTFSLSCSGPDGNAVAMLSVAVVGVVTLDWQPPAENVDGTPLSDLAGYRIYYGVDSRDYSSQVTVADQRSTSQDVELVSGSYYFAMTAIDADGNESAYSNEVVKVID